MEMKFDFMTCRKSTHWSLNVSWFISETFIFGCIFQIIMLRLAKTENWKTGFCLKFSRKNSEAVKCIFDMRTIVYCHSGYLLPAYTYYRALRNHGPRPSGLAKSMGCLTPPRQSSGKSPTNLEAFSLYVKLQLNQISSIVKSHSQ